jgi:hypothetical protein
MVSDEINGILNDSFELEISGFSCPVTAFEALYQAVLIRIIQFKENESHHRKGKQ